MVPEVHKNFFYMMGSKSRDPKNELRKPNEKLQDGEKTEQAVAEGDDNQGIGVEKAVDGEKSGNDKGDA